MSIVDYKNKTTKKSSFFEEIDNLCNAFAISCKEASISFSDFERSLNEVAKLIRNAAEVPNNLFFEPNVYSSFPILKYLNQHNSDLESPGVEKIINYCEPIECCPVCNSGRTVSDIFLNQHLVKFICEDCGFEAPCASDRKKAAEMWDFTYRTMKNEI